MAHNDDLRVFAPRSLTDALRALADNPGASLSAGTTSLARRGRPVPRIALGGTVISLSGLDELRQSNHTERFLDLGSMMTLSEVLDLGERFVPPALMQALRGIARPTIRNLATVGGNLCDGDRRMDLLPVLALLDAQAELKKEGSQRWLPVSRIFPEEGPRGVEGDEILTRVRIPLDIWDVNLVRKVGNRDVPDESTFVFVFLAKTSRSAISDLRIAYSGHAYFRRKVIESNALGKALPLSAADVSAITDAYRAELEAAVTIPSVRRTQFLSLLEFGLEYLSA